MYDNDTHRLGLLHYIHIIQHNIFCKNIHRHFKLIHSAAHAQRTQPAASRSEILLKPLSCRKRATIKPASRVGQQGPQKSRVEI